MMILREIRIEKIVPNKYQPRRESYWRKIKELKQNQMQNKMGLLQSITVRDMGNDFGELIAGERRLRALKIFRVSGQQAIVKELTNEQMATSSINWKYSKGGINPIEEAYAYQELYQ